MLFSKVTLGDGRTFVADQLSPSLEVAYESAAARAISVLQAEQSLKSVIGRVLESRFSSEFGFGSEIATQRFLKIVCIQVQDIIT